MPVRFAFSAWTYSPWTVPVASFSASLLFVVVDIAHGEDGVIDHRLPDEAELRRARHAPAATLIFFIALERLARSFAEGDVPRILRFPDIRAASNALVHLLGRKGHPSFRRD